MRSTVPTFPQLATQLHRDAGREHRGHDPEALHRLRVGCRRARVGLALAGKKELERTAAAIAHALGPLRDLDVVLMRADLPPSARAIAQRERAAHVAVAKKVLGSARFLSLLQALRRLPDVDRVRAKRKARKLKARAEAAATKWKHRSGRGERAVRRCHQLRRRLRALRDAKLWLGGDVETLQARIHALGAISDATVSWHLAQGWRHQKAWARRQRRAVRHALQAAE